ncbi:MAG: hypothetical protein A3B47_00635 [Candidatus Levybacteria bacterium RIFCSPLOWO2_01_FULL_39_24]|nr:MAG: hypothetical protein A2800_00555 [Candidatus Levybacteria bacterium RIFCSPHIGHO2_01_FULL_40_16]OGH28507.1 MAG: hypothetical protein A3E12_01160 [Candidatus Levybacteria bacterium RIFCSPHIGHO2_12_FULL_39_9]OGH46281.1 MAG: hypothetical protein A3B47_00635 [Candidatus Levybacteria bacterium RIFCSPLOWO2_01_FULL_39_24]
MEPQLNCPNCKQNIATSDYFCPNCGKKLKDKPLSTTIARQIFVYSFSLLLPPLGLWPAIRYLKQESDKARMIGFIAIVLTIISTAVELWLGLGFINTFNQQFNQQLNSNLNLYR